MATRKPGRARIGEPTGVRALERGLRLLEELGSGEALSLSELARRAELTPSTTYRLLETLRRRHFVDWDELSGLWRIGLRAYQIGQAFCHPNSLSSLALEAMQRLVARINETVNLAVLDGAEAVYIQQVESRQMLRMFTQLGARVPLHCTGVGKVLLAWRSEEEVRQLLGPEPLVAFTPHTLTRVDAVLQELERVRRLGYAVDREEREIGVRCLAAPVRDATGRVVAALSLSAPAVRLPERRLAELAPVVLETTRDLSLRLGWQPETAPLPVDQSSPT
ncbi:IclR family transcriptional regulator [Rhodothermus marinus]|uniref:Transcriptional regulator, IclR family n=1 Tax=Rhodothermus marinus (strain ATCC 43812 / DSM 4252 / R-10) TaxID=518766 RepID=D0MDP9_RHOM4|nr:IclR family transcriptional regulator [Rhodothermus marinus]ACY49043.1 transcriptional regulator, IclR family [Rhodothermus marinus DSM 4252]